MQAYVDKQILPSKIIEGAYEINFYGNKINCVFKNSKYFEFRSEALIELKLFKEELIKLKPTVILFSGGEPLLQKQAMIELIDFCKKMKIKIALKTNGTKSDVLKYFLQKSFFDIIVFDLITSQENFKKITKAGTFFESAEKTYFEIIESINLLKEYDKEVDIIFRTLIVPGSVYRKEVFLELAKIIKDLKCVWELEKFNPEDNAELFKKIEPPSNQFLETLKRIILENYSNMNIELV